MPITLIAVNKFEELFKKEKFDIPQFQCIKKFQNYLCLEALKIKNLSTAKSNVESSKARI